MPKKTNEELIQLAKEYVEKADQNAKLNPTSDSIQIVVVEPNKKPYKMTIPNELVSMQEIVGGYMELLHIGRTDKDGRVAITLNEEGKLFGLPMNRRIIGSGGADFLVGTFFVTAYNMQGDNISLNDQECEKYIRLFTPMEVYV
jgi:hypothetical protein